MTNSFIHLHVHTHYSLLEALPKIDDLIKKAQDEGLTSLAITDNGNMYGTIEFYEKCKKAGIKPILGLDAYVALRGRKDKEARIDNRNTRLVLLAKNEIGYKNLIKLVTDSNVEGFYYKPRIDKETLQKWSEGLICISPALSGEISTHLYNGEKAKALETIKFYQKVFQENFYLEISHYPEIDAFKKLRSEIISIAQETNTKLVAANEIFYLKPEDQKAFQTLISIQNSFGSHNSIFETRSVNFPFISPKKMAEFFSDVPEALENTNKIAEQCNVEIKLGEWKFPNFVTADHLDPDLTLTKLAEEGLETRKIKENDEIRERIKYELEVIKNKGYSKYFLVVADIFSKARELKIQSNTRGSAAGSFVCYLIGITDVNPIEFGLPFERFLNPERPSAPDIDMDFADTRRDELIDYCREKYGENHVAQIGTFGTMLARGSVRDVARAMGFEYSVADRIAKLIPMGAQGFPMTIKRALEDVPELREIYENEEDANTIISMAQKIEGCVRHIGVHAAGVVISPEPLTEYVPVQFDPKGEKKLITQYDMHAVGEDGIGLLKFDFLGLKNLTIIGDALRLIKKIEGQDLNVNDFPLDDPKTYAMLSRGETTATFQLNGQGMTKFLKELKPSNINDINAMVALYRPGPLAFIPDYIERKHDPSKVVYLDERFEKIIGKTFGILIYQDDIMLIAVNFAGYSWGEADKFRKAMGKKIPEIMAQQKEKFTTGCVNVGGLSEEKVKKLWESIETFAAYGFNKGHAASYGRVAYLTSYLKANYPEIYMAAVLTADAGETEKIAEMVVECQKMGIEILPPDINESFEDFTVVSDKENVRKKIRFGLTTIKNFGAGISHEIIEERKKSGPFKTLEDFISRIQSRSFNKKSLEALIKTGALDSLGERNEMIENLEEILTFNKEVAKNSGSQENLFANSNINTIPLLKLKKVSPTSQEQKLNWEKELLGLYLSGHPLDKFKKDFPNIETNIGEIKKEAQAEMTVKLLGHVETVKEIITKKGDQMAFVKIADLNDSAEVILFPEVYAKNKNILQAGNCIIVKGKTSYRNDEFSVLVEKVEKLDNLIKKSEI